MSKKRIVLTVLFALLSLIWMSVIFGFSSNDAEESTEQSHGVVELILKIFIPNFDDMQNADREELISKYDKPVRKTAHFAAYAFLGFLLYLCFGCLKWLPERKILPSLFSLPLCVLFAFSDEYHQTFVDGRAGRLSDVLIDSSGALAGVLFAAGTVMVVLGCLKSKKHRI